MGRVGGKQPKVRPGASESGQLPQQVRRELVRPIGTDELQERVEVNAVDDDAGVLAVAATLAVLGYDPAVIVDG